VPKTIVGSLTLSGDPSQCTEAFKDQMKGAILEAAGLSSAGGVNVAVTCSEGSTVVDYVIELSDEFVPPPESGGVELSDEYIAARVASINDKFATTEATGSFLAARVTSIEADAVQTVDLAVVAAPEPPPDEPPTVTDPPPTKAPATDLGSGVALDSVGELSAEDSPPLAGGVVAIIVIGAILLVVLVLGAIAYAAKTKGFHSNPQIPWGYRPSTPPAGATGGATDRKRKSVDEVSVLVTTTPRGSNYLGPGAPTNEGGIHLGGAENVRVSTALPDVAEAPAGAETGSTDIEANSN
jgi:hypothetical protein